MSIKAKVSGSYQQVQKVHAKVAGEWKEIRNVKGKVAGTWQTLYENEYVYTFATGVLGSQDLDLLGLDKFNKVRVIIPAGCTIVADSTSAYAIKTGTGYGNTLTIENNGSILGRGGNGGNGGGSSVTGGEAGYAGSAGGDAIHVECDVTIDNNGTIAGGGGGGGGGGGYNVNVQNGSDPRASGGGGGGGAPYGLGGAAPYSPSQDVPATNGAAATLTTAGAGGTGGVSAYSSLVAGYGGAGGAYTTDGSAGEPSRYNVAGGGAAGADGEEYYNPSAFTITQI